MVRTARTLLGLLSVLALPPALIPAADADPPAVRKAASFYASFDEQVAGSNNGGIWFDFNDAKPRDLRMGVFPAVAEGQKPIPESDPNAPMVRVPGVGFKVGQWHHVVVTWNNFDTGKPNAVAVLYIDGKRIG